ncbi:MAG: DUF58 domain-containing protein [Nanoarchaeota archaeon]
MVKIVDKKLNSDIAGSIALFQSVMKSFEIRTKVYRTMLKGRGLEFDGYRDYAPDDDASVIDWKASLRVNKILAKQYTEERNLKIVFILDVGEKMVFGSTDKLKCEYSVEVVAALANLILTSRDKVGYVLFEKSVKEFVHPQVGKKHFVQFMNMITDASTYGGRSDLENVLDFTLKYIDKSIASVVIVSDFIGMDESIKHKLALVSSQFETMALVIRDPIDRTLPDIQGELVIEDPATEERMLINPSLAKSDYEKFAREQENFVQKTFFELGIDALLLTTDKPFVSNLATFIKQRAKSKKGVIV